MQKYFSLTKPGMVRGNVIVAAAAFVFASGGNINWILLFFTITGLALVVASACVFNNYYDRNIDARMERTKERALAKGVVSGERALFFGLLLFVLGVIALQIHTTQYALFAALTGFFVYVFLYTPLKHQHSSALYVGAFAGATPPLVGYMAVLPQLDTTALLLFFGTFFVANTALCCDSPIPF